MKKSSLFTQIIMAALLSSLFIIGCKKETSEALTPDEEKQAATISSESETETELAFNDVFDNVIGVNNDVGLAGVGVFGRKAIDANGREYNLDSLACLTITLTRLNGLEPFPLRVVMDFGSGCLAKDGHVRSGKIITTYTGRLIVPGKSAETIFDGYKIDSISIRGTHTITNTTAQGTNQRQFTVDVNGRLSKPSGDYAEWISHRIITQVEGNITDSPLDDIFTIQGYAQGVVKRGNVKFGWQSEIIEPLRKSFICKWISKGILKVRRESLSTSSPFVATLNYGGGTCDFLATITIGTGLPVTIQLPH